MSRGNDAMKVWILVPTSDFDGCDFPTGAYSSKELAEAAMMSGDPDDIAETEIVELELDAKPR
jgi:hypothetical protein